MTCPIHKQIQNIFSSACILQSKLILLRLGRYHRHVGIPTDYFGVMPNIFLHAVRPYLERVDMWNEDTQDAWMSLFSHITRVMTHGHNHYHLIETSAVAASTAPTTTHHYLSESTKHSAEESASALVSMSHQARGRNRLVSNLHQTLQKITA